MSQEVQHKNRTRRKEIKESKLKNNGRRMEQDESKEERKLKKNNGGRMEIGGFKTRIS